MKPRKHSSIDKSKQNPSQCLWKHHTLCIGCHSTTDIPNHSKSNCDKPLMSEDFTWHSPEHKWKWLIYNFYTAHIVFSTFWSPSIDSFNFILRMRIAETQLATWRLCRSRPCWPESWSYLCPTEECRKQFPFHRSWSVTHREFFRGRILLIVMQRWENIKGDLRQY